MWYNVDINRLVELLTPTFLRKPKQMAWLKALHFPLIEIVYQFNFNRNKNLYNLAHNGQICYLRKVLNDRFDTMTRRIKINDGNRYRRQYLYTDAEQRPKFLGTIYLYDEADYSDTGVDFIVLVPSGLIYNAYEMNAIIEFYKLASKRYKIQTY